MTERLGVPRSFPSAMMLSVDDMMRYVAASKATDQKQWRSEFKNALRAQNTLVAKVITLALTDPDFARVHMHLMPRTARETDLIR